MQDNWPLKIHGKLFIIVMTQKCRIAILPCLFFSLSLRAEFLTAAAESLGEKKRERERNTLMQPWCSVLFMLTAAFDLENDVPLGPVVSILLLD